MSDSKRVRSAVAPAPRVAGAAGVAAPSPSPAAGAAAGASPAVALPQQQQRPPLWVQLLFQFVGRDARTIAALRRVSRAFALWGRYYVFALVAPAIRLPPVSGHELEEITRRLPYVTSAIVRLPLHLRPRMTPAWAPGLPVAQCGQPGAGVVGSPAHPLSSFDVLAALTPCTRLVQLHVGNVAHPGSERSVQAFQRWPNLADFEADNCGFLSPPVLRAVSAAPLRRLMLRRIANVSSTGLAEALRALARSLVVLSVVECPQVDDSVFELLAQPLQQLKRLQWMQCRLSDVGLQHVCRVAPGLQVVELHNANYGLEISDAGIGVLARGCRALTSVDVSVLTQITGHALYALAEQLPALAVLNIAGAQRVTAADSDALLRMPALQQLHCSSGQVAAEVHSALLAGRHSPSGRAAAVTIDPYASYVAQRSAPAVALAAGV